MTDNNLNLLETLVKGMQKLVEEEKYVEAKAIADELNLKGYSRELICRACWPYMERLIKLDWKKAEEFGSAFREYNFHYWLKIKNGQHNIFKSK